MPWLASLPGLMHSVCPMRRSPPDSWMWPWMPRSGWYFSISRRTAVEPTGPRSTSPAETVGRRFSSSSGAVSSPESCGGTWIMNTARRGSLTCFASASSRSYNSSSDSSRGVCHGVWLDQLQAARQIDDLAVDVDRPPVGTVEDLVDTEIVVVARDQIQRHVAVGEPLGGQRHPRLDALVHQPAEELVAAGFVGRQPAGFLGRGDERVVADVGDVALERRELFVAACGAVHPEQLGLVAAVALDDRDDRLAGQVAGEQRGVRLVDVQPDRVDVLPPRLLGGVQIACYVQARGHQNPPGTLVGRQLGEQHLLVDAGL